MQPDLHCRTLAAHTLKHFRALSPLTHCMTNDVVQTFTANTLLALGASPAMVIDPVEARPFAAIANALLVNVGTLTASRADAMRGAVESAYDAKRRGRLILSRWARWNFVGDFAWISCPCARRQYAATPRKSWRYPAWRWADVA